MKAIQGIFAEYIAHRNQGHSQADTLDTMRHHIEPLSKSNKREFITVMRAWERELLTRQRRAGVKPSSDRITTRVLEPLVVMVPPGDEMIERHKRLTQSMPVVNLSDEEKVELNGKGVSVKGQAPESKTDTKEAEVLNYPEEHAAKKTHVRGSDRFTSNDVLEIEIEMTGHRFRLSPQGNKNEVFVGRSALRGALAPDVDLSGCNGARLGVSQLHLSIQFNQDEKKLLVYDLNSTNGSYLNGVSISPNEPQPLHDGDELRLGLLTMAIRFRHNAAEELVRRIS